MSIQDFSRERRQFGRRQSQLRGAVRFRGDLQQSCTIRNYSESGALVVLDDDVDLPQHFILTIHRTGLKLQCSIRHRNGASYGVQFQDAAGKIDSPADTQPALLAYHQLLALATAERESEEFDARYGHALRPAAPSPNGRLKNLARI